MNLCSELNGAISKVVMAVKIFLSNLAEWMEEICVLCAVVIISSYNLKGGSSTPAWWKTSIIASHVIVLSLPIFGLLQPQLFINNVSTLVPIMFGGVGAIGLLYLSWPFVAKDA